MPLDKNIIQTINDYALNHLPIESWYETSFFPFIEDNKLRNRLIVEFKNARFIYKLFEGLQVNGELLLAQVKTQVIMYASIQEAVASYVLFEKYNDTEIVQNLLFQERKKDISIPQKNITELKKILKHNGKDLSVCYVTKTKVDKTKIRFDQKIRALFDLSLISEDLMKDLIKIYEYRNTIHLEAEIKKNFKYDLEIGRLGYRRVEGLSIELANKLSNLDLLTPLSE
ncbi:MAG: hypothetical protein RBQ97_12610 [Acholeplasma sp.]|nr:hypothetical protein [Acholeplasma sp.]